MILQALKEYYDRVASDPESDAAPAGWEWREIPYVIILDKGGNPVMLSCTYEGEGRNRRAKRFMVPQSVKKTSGISSNLLWENPEYALGVELKGRPKRVREQHSAFIEKCKNLGIVEDLGLDAVRSFLKIEDKERTLEDLDGWNDLKESGANLSFGLAGEPGLVVGRSAVKEAVDRLFLHRDQGQDGLCLLTGEVTSIQRLHTAIKGVRGAQTSGANIVSFNLDAFSSFGKKQGENAPIGTSAADGYTKALNRLLGKDSEQKMSVGDATTVFWSEMESELEEGFLDIFGEPPKDDPDRCTRAVKSLFKAVENGALSVESDSNKFFVLGLAPNASRISIRFWIVDSVFEMASKILAHFEDLQLVHGPKERGTLSLFRLLVSISALGKSENIPPNLAGDTMRAILEGLPYPQTLLQAAVRRNRAEQSVTYPRASLIKAYINRLTRFNNSNIKEELKVNLDTSNTNIGYRLGRLFATLEKVQAEANPGINATIRDRFYGAASGTPVAVFSNLMRLKNHHLAKLENKGRRIYFERLFAEVMDGVKDFPSHLSLPDQGRFAIGYYHQCQKFYTNNETEINHSQSQTEGERAND